MSYDKRITDIAAQAALAAGKNASVAPQLLVADITFVLADAVEDGRIILPTAPAKSALYRKNTANRRTHSARKAS